MKRRDFLQLALVTAAAAAIPKVLPEPEPDSHVIKEEEFANKWSVAATDRGFGEVGPHFTWFGDPITSRLDCPPDTVYFMDPRHLNA